MRIGKVRKLLFCGLITIAINSMACFIVAAADEIPSHIKEACGRHIDYLNRYKEEKGECESISKNIFQAASESKDACASAADYLKTSHEEMDNLDNTSAAEVEVIRSKVLSTDISANGAFQAVYDANKSAFESFQKKQNLIAKQIEQVAKHHSRLAKAEKNYEDMGNTIRNQGNNSDGARECRVEYRNYYAGNIIAGTLDRDVSSIRKNFAKRLEKLNALYQENLLKLGASRQQAVQAAKNLKGLSGGDDGVSLNEKGGIKGAPTSAFDRVKQVLGLEKDGPQGEKSWKYEGEKPYGSEGTLSPTYNYRSQYDLNKGLSDEVLQGLTKPLVSESASPAPAPPAPVEPTSAQAATATAITAATATSDPAPAAPVPSATVNNQAAADAPAVAAVEPVLSEPEKTAEPKIKKPRKLVVPPPVNNEIMDRWDAAAASAPSKVVTPEGSEITYTGSTSGGKLKEKSTDGAIRSYNFTAEELALYKSTKSTQGADAADNYLKNLVQSKKRQPASR